MKKLLWPAIIVLGVILLLGGIAAVGKVVFGSRFDAELAALKSKGEPTTLEELIGEPIPADRNAATQYMQIRALIEGGAHEAGLKVIDEFASQKGPISPDQWKSARSALAGTQPMRLLLDEALARPECRFEINMQDPTSTLYPHLAVLRRMSRWLKVDAMVSARDGRMDRAADDICSQVAIARSIEDEPFILHHIMRMALLSISAKSALTAAEYGDFSEAEARRIFDSMGALDCGQSYRQGWRGERTMLLHYSDPVNATNYLTSASYSATGSTSPAQMLGGPLAVIYTQTTMKGDLAVFMRIAKERMDGASLSYRDAVAKGMLTSPPRLPSYAWLTGTLVPVFAEAGFSRYRTEAAVARARVFLALQAYRDRFGEYPASMQELKSKLGWKLPNDPFSDKDLFYKRQARGFILYSVGPDMKDDGGSPVPNETIERDDKGDIVLKWEK